MPNPFNKLKPFNIDQTASFTFGGLTVANIANINIAGGNTGYVLSTDGTGNLSWTEQTGGSGSGTPAVAPQIKDSFTGDGTTTQFTIARAPYNKDSLQVFVENVYQEEDAYSLSGNVVTFTSAPEANVSIEIITNDTSPYQTKDTFVGNGTETVFTLSVIPYNKDSIIVFVNNVYQNDTSYSLAFDELTFTSAPAVNSIIEVVIRKTGVEITTDLVQTLSRTQEYTATSNQTDFIFTEGYTTGSVIDVFVDGLKLLQTQFTATTGNSVSLTTGATAGSKVQIIAHYSSAAATILPNQSGNTGKYLTTDGNVIAWSTPDLLPSRSGNTDYVLSNDGNIATWVNINNPIGDYITEYVQANLLPSQANSSGKYLTTNGTTASWATISALPTQTSNSGKYLTTNGTTASWATISALPTQTSNSGKYLTTDGTTASWATVSSTPADGSITPAKLNLGTESFLLSAGNTLQRPSAPANGAVRFNTETGFGELYTPSGWTNFGGAQPILSSASPTSFAGTIGTLFTLTGSKFTSDATVRFVTSSGTEYTAAVVGYTNSTTITATTPRNFTVADEPLSIKIIQGGGQATLTNYVDCGGSPTWTTTAGSLGTYMDSDSVNVTLSATDPDGSSVTYSLETGSLGGLTLNSSTGVISGTFTGLSVLTTYSFTIGASDSAGNKTTRSFSYQVYPGNPNNIVPGVLAWYDMTSWNNTTKVWSDKIGTYHTSAATGSPTTATSSGVNGASKTFSCIAGTTASQIAWPTGILPSTFTFFHITRYVGTNTARIFSALASEVNWLDGFWGNYSGVSYHNGWITQSSSSVHGNNWVLSSSQNSLYRSQGVQRGTGGGGSSCRLYINGQEASDYQVAEVIIYNSTLTTAQIQSIEAYLSNKYGITTG